MIHKEQALKKGIKIIDSKEAKNALFENLKTHFPQTIKDNQVDLHAIATLLGLETKANIQGYELTFTGKALANALYSTPTQKLLKFEESFNVRSAESSKEDSNFIIKGDNLDVLKILKAAYSEKIKMIYIDPPYNTKNDNFIYPDNFRKDYKAILQEVGLLEIDDEGNEVESETLQFFKNIQGSRTHSGWLSFMLPRLKLARDLLREDGVIFISIDDNEQANLKILCDEIFGEENFVGQIIWLKGNAQNDADTIQSNQEYILCYAKDIESKPISTIKQETKVKAFKDSKTGKFYYEGAGLTTGGAGGTLNARPNLGFSIYYNPKTQDFFAKDDYDRELAKISNDENEVYTSDSSFLEAGYEVIRPPKKGVGLGRWTWALDKFNTSKADILIRKNTNGYVVLKKEWLDSKKVKQDENGEYYAMIEKQNPPKSFIDFAGSGRGIKELKDLMRDKVFNNPKNTILLKHLLKISTNANTESVITSETKQSSIHNENLDCHDLQSKSRNDTDLESKAGEAEVSCDDFVGCQGGGEGSLLNINDRADNADSRKSTQETTPDIVLDFFAGSGTTAHAVMELNAEDGGNRKCILVQIDEPINESKNKVAYDFCKNELKSKNPAISDITIERVKRASAKIASQNKDFNASFAVSSLSDKPELITTKKGTLELLSNANLSPFDKALNLALQSGKTLDKPLKTIFENKLYQCEDCLYLIACDKEVLEFLRKTQNEYIFIDGFEDLHLEDFLNLDSSLSERLRVVY